MRMQTTTPYYWDYVAPLIDTMTLDEGRQQVTIAVTDPHTTSDWRNPWWQPQTVQLLATRPDGNTQILEPIASRNPTTNAYFYEFNLSPLDEGQYTLTDTLILRKIQGVAKVPHLPVSVR